MRRRAQKRLQVRSQQVSDSLGKSFLLKTILSKFVVAVMAAFSMTLAVPVAAHAEPTGQYSYICIGANGSSYTMRSGEKLGNCKGSYLKKYINGNQVDSIRLAGNGTLARPVKKEIIDCVVAVYGTGRSAYVLIKKKGTDKFSWIGLGLSLKGLKSCVA